MRYYVVDAFADRVFEGNPAGVCVTDAPLPDGLMQRIAAENNLSETAFAGERVAISGRAVLYSTAELHVGFED